MKTLFGKVKKEEEAAGIGLEPPKEEKPGETEAPPRYRREGEKYIFGPKVVPVWRLPEPEPEPPKGDDVLHYDSLPFDKMIGEASGEILQARKNKDGVMFVGFKVKLQMKDDILSGWMSEADFMKYRREAVARGWRSAGRRG